MEQQNGQQTDNAGIEYGDILKGYTKALQYLEITDEGVHASYKKMVSLFDKAEYRYLMSLLESNIKQGLFQGGEISKRIKGYDFYFGFTDDYCLYVKSEYLNLLGSKQTNFILINPCIVASSVLQVGECIDFACVYTKKKGYIYFGQRKDSENLQLLRKTLEKKEIKELIKQEIARQESDAAQF